MMHRAGLLTIATATAIVASPAIVTAQRSGSGSCTAGPDIECSQIFGSDGEGRDERYWLVAVVLWRRDRREPDTMVDTAVRRAISNAYRDAKRAAEDANRFLLGGFSNDPFNARMAAASYTLYRRPDTLYVAGARFIIPRRGDPALVVMVDQFDGNRPEAVVGSAVIPADMPDHYWPKTWSSGDTTFTIFPRSGTDPLREALMRVAAIREFLR